MVGKNLIDLKDIDGKPFVKERVEAAKVKGDLLAGLQVHQPGQQEDRAQADVLRAPRRHDGLWRHLQALNATCGPAARWGARPEQD
jgi:hypothetical protein